MKTITTTVAAIMLTATFAYADDLEGSFSGGVSTFSNSGGVSFTSSMGGDTSSSIRNESGAGQFSGSTSSFELDDTGGTVTSESFTEGFDFSNTQVNGGFGESFAGRGGVAAGSGSFGEGLSSDFYEDNVFNGDDVFNSDNVFNSDGYDNASNNNNYEDYENDDDYEDDDEYDDD